MLKSLGSQGRQVYIVQFLIHNIGILFVRDSHRPSALPASGGAGLALRPTGDDGAAVSQRQMQQGLHPSTAREPLGRPVINIAPFKLHGILTVARLEGFWSVGSQRHGFPAVVAQDQ
jgi:hypothetical protein